MSCSKTPRLRLAVAVREIFGAKCKASWLSGSFAYDGARAGHSDIDVVVVLGKAIRAPAGADTTVLIRRFVDEYLALHAAHGLQPDLDFPGEFLTELLIQQAAEGRGLACDGSLGRLWLSAVESEEYWINRPDRWFRAWLSMTAFSQYLAGSRSYHSAAKLCAWKTILRFVLLHAGTLSLVLDDVFDRLTQFGVKERYRSFRAVEHGWVHRALHELAAEGALQLANGQIVPMSGRLDIWGRELCKKLADPHALPPLLLDVQDTRHLSTYASERWAALSPVKG